MITIIIPYYKFTFFETTLKSLSNQTDKRFKVYIGDDASPENPSDLLDKYKGKFDFEYHRFENNLGGISLTQQWDRCIALSNKEEWIMILGDDDFIGDTVVELWHENFDIFYKKANVIRFASKLIYQETNRISEIYFHPVWESAADSLYRKFTHQTRSSLSEHIFSRQSYIKFGFYDYPLAWNSDDRAWLDFSDGKSIFTINDSLVYIRLSGINISGQQENIHLKNLSVISFFRFLTKKKLSIYNIKQREKILRFYESEINKNGKLKLSEWLFLLFCYFKYLNLYSIKKLSIRFAKNILKR
jgi:glycosyltransferase involved in cell wall biosynthesis